MVSDASKRFRASAEEFHERVRAAKWWDAFTMLWYRIAGESTETRP